MMTAIFINCDSARFYGSQPKDTARTLKIQRAACYSRVSGSMSAHLAQVKNRSWQRVARIRICTGILTQG